MSPPSWYNAVARLPEDLRTAFWDVAFDDLDDQRDRDFAVSRIAEYGADAAVRWLWRNYSEEEIAGALERRRSVLSARTLSLWRIWLAKPEDCCAEIAKAFYSRSLDYDFFSPEPFQPSALAASLAGVFASSRVLEMAPGTLTLEIEATKAAFFHYPNPLLEEPERVDGLFPVAGLLDLALMKLAAIGDRGSRKDFTDLFAILRAGALSSRSSKRCLGSSRG